MYLPRRESLTYLTLSFSLTYFVLQLAIAPELKTATPVFPTTEHNRALPRDVDGDGVVREKDTALLFESLRSLENSLPILASEVCTAHPYLDVNDDGFLSEDDAKLMFDTVEFIASIAPAIGPHSPSEMRANPVLARR